MTKTPTRHLLLLLLACVLVLLAPALAQTTNSTAAIPQVRFIRDYIPLNCPVAIKPNYLATFHYTAHLVTKDNRVGEVFDETADYAPLTLPVNARALLPPLAQGMLNACIDERRTIVVPHQYAVFDSLPANTDLVFLVHIIDVVPNNDIFDIIDTDNDGCIVQEEMVEYVKASGRVQQNLYEATARRLMRHSDKNRDGVVECEELLGGLSKNCDVVTSCKAKRDALDTFFDNFNTEHHITADDLI